MITCDLQQVLFTPNLRCSSSFYLRKLSNYNLGITLANTNIAHMHIWSETMAKRGSNEVASCIYHFITTNYEVLENGQTRTLVLWSDRCCGQNNNVILIEMLMRLIRMNYFSHVEQNFFVTGHSFNDCDRHFASIEKVMKKNTIILPTDIEKIILEAQIETPFHVTWMQRENFLDFKNLLAFWTRPRLLQVTKNLWYQIDANAPRNLFSRESHCIVNILHFSYRY